MSSATTREHYSILFWYSELLYILANFISHVTFNSRRTPKWCRYPFRGMGERRSPGKPNSRTTP